MNSDKIFLELKRISKRLAADCSALHFGPQIAAVYNPLEYAWRPHNMYLKLAGSSQKKVIFMGMNPGPWGMAQTGVPFGEISIVRDWLGIEAVVDKPEKEHPKRPIEGFSCTRSEVSGRRLWGLFRERYKKPEKFFIDHFVGNYCPLVFMEESGANVTPDKLPMDEAAPLYKICDSALAEIINVLKPQWVIGIGGFAKKRIDKLPATGFATGQILHPSPASPKANAGWDKEAIKTLVELGIWQ